MIKVTLRHITMSLTTLTITIIIIFTNVHLLILHLAHLYHSNCNHHHSAHMTVHYAAALLLVVQPKDLFTAQPTLSKQNLILGLPT